MHAIIVDDEPHSSNVLSTDLALHCPEVTISSIFNDSRDAIKWLSKNKPELVFLDIMMPHINGIELLEQLQPVNFHVIFTTAYNQFATKAFRLSAVDYLEKPISSEDLMEAIRKVNQLQFQTEQLQVLRQNLLNDHKNKKLALPNSKGFDFVNVQDVIWLESDGNFTKVYLADKVFHVTSLLKQMETTLEPFGFFRIHHKYMVNLKKLDKYERGDGGNVILSNRVNLPVSRDKKQDFLERIKE